VHRRLEWMAGMAFMAVIAGLVGCASRSANLQTPGRSNVLSSASHANTSAGSLSNVGSVLRSRLASTDAVVVTGPGVIRVRFIDAAIFSPDAAGLSSDADEILLPLAVALAESPGTNVEVQAYSDDLDSIPQALATTQRRAELVGLYLTEHGVASGRIRIRGEGRIGPIEDNSQPEGRRANRRVEILISALSS